jgi:hypothetical protein
MPIIGSDGNERKTIRVARDEINDAVKKKEDIQFQETKILQKVNKAHREAFREKFPGQLEHCMRLTAERLQAVLTNKTGELNDPATWSVTANEIHDLAHGLYYLSIMNQHYPVEGE